MAVGANATAVVLSFLCVLTVACGGVVAPPQSHAESGAASVSNGGSAGVGSGAASVTSGGAAAPSRSGQVSIGGIASGASTGSVSGVPSGAPFTGIPSGAPFTGIPSGAPFTGIPSGAPFTGIPSGAPFTGIPSGAPFTGIPSGAPFTGIPSGAPFTGIPSGAPQGAPCIAPIATSGRYDGTVGGISIAWSTSGFGDGQVTWTSGRLPAGSTTCIFGISPQLNWTRNGTCLTAQRDLAQACGSSFVCDPINIALTPDECLVLCDNPHPPQRCGVFEDNLGDHLTCDFGCGYAASSGVP